MFTQAFERYDTLFKLEKNPSLSMNYVLLMPQSTLKSLEREVGRTFMFASDNIHSLLHSHCR